MKALTVCQPYAHLIALPDDHERAKRVENRSWPTSLRGEILIHAGKSKKYLALSDDGLMDEDYELPLADMAWGAFVAIANLADSVYVGMNGRVVPDHARRRWPWLEMHEHTEGPHCFVLTQVRALPKPIPFRGAQGFFEVPREIVDAARAQFETVSR